jgi:hypothetical protein
MTPTNAGDTDTSTYEIEKFARDGQGRWFGMGARRFATLPDADAYFAEFAASQSRVLSNGLRIDMRTRKGRTLIACVGGTMTDPATIRRFEARRLSPETPARSQK